MEHNFERVKRSKIKNATDPSQLGALLMDDQNIPELLKSLKYSELNTGKRDACLKEMQKFISESLLCSCHHSVKCQTEEAVWNTIPNQLKYKYFEYE